MDASRGGREARKGLETKAAPKSLLIDARGRTGRPRSGTRRLRRGERVQEMSHAEFAEASARHESHAENAEIAEVWSRRLVRSRSVGYPRNPCHPCEIIEPEGARRLCGPV